MSASFSNEEGGGTKLNRAPEEDPFSSDLINSLRAYSGSYVESEGNETTDYVAGTQEKNQDGGASSSVRKSKQPKENETAIAKISGPCSPLDSFLSSYVTLTGSSTHTDRILKLLQYGSWIAAHLTRNRPGQLSAGLRKIDSHLSLTRYSLRLLGFPSAIDAIRTGSWGAGYDDVPWVGKLGKIMAWSMAFYYPLEHAAFGRWISPELISADAGKCTSLSCRFWLVYIWADLVQSWVKLKEIATRKRLLLEARSSVGEDEIHEKVDGLDKEAKLNKLQIVRCLLYSLPAVNWSLPKWEREPLLKEGLLKGLMFSESVLSLYQSVCSLR